MAKGYKYMTSIERCPVCGNKTFRLSMNGGMNPPLADFSDPNAPIGILAELTCEKCWTIFQSWDKDYETPKRLVLEKLNGQS